MKPKYGVDFIDFEWLERLIDCREACPVHTNAGGYVNLIAQERYLESYIVAREPNPMASICGRVCAHPCETACRRGRIDEPISIRALKRIVCERYGVESKTPVRIEFPEGKYYPKEKKGDKKEKIAVVGAGPCGLSCAHDLAIFGYDVTLFEASPVAGGMLYLGIPEYRLSRFIIRNQVNSVLDLGVTLKTNFALGRDFSIKDLKKQDFAAIFIAIGAHKSRDLRIPGTDIDGVLRGVEFLLNVNLGFKVELGQRVLVIGGGNVAIDVARSAARKVIDEKKLSYEGMTVAMDVSLSALRMGAKEVHLICLEAKDEMPAHEYEVEEAISEGIILHPSLGPKQILEKNGKAVGLETIKVASVFDAQGRFNPTFIDGTESVIEGDTVIMAIGQMPDLSFIRDEDGIEVSTRGTIKINTETFETSAKGIFAGGDVGFGPRLIIDSTSDGRKAASSIDSYLRGKKKIKKRIFNKIFKKNYEMPSGYEKTERVKVPMIPIDRRIGIAEVELGYNEEMAIKEAERCLKCHISPIFHSEKCILCGGCVDVCPKYCLKIIRLNMVSGRPEILSAINNRYNLSAESFEDLGKLDFRDGCVIIKDENICIRCGLCAKRCPTDAITMEAFSFEEEYEYAG